MNEFSVLTVDFFGNYHEVLTLWGDYEAVLAYCEKEYYDEIYRIEVIQ